MASITSSIGLVSGINTSDIIDQLITLESKPKDLIQARIDSVKSQKDAYTGLAGQLTTLKTSATSLKKPSFFEAATANSSDEDVVTATASNGAAVGSFQFQVARLVTSQQTVSQGFVDYDKSPVGAGTITIEQGGGDLSNETVLSDLNGGNGVRRGSFRIIDRSGAAATIDISAAVSLDDVVKKINTALGIQVRATIQNDKLVLTDQTGKTTNDLIVSDVGDGHSASDLGIVGDVAATSVTGSDVNYLSTKTSLAKLNDGRGIRTNSDATANDLTINDGGGAIGISLAGAKTLGDAITAINTAGAGRFKAEIAPGSNAITLTANGGGTVTVANVAGSKAADDLGLTGSGSGAINGKPVLAGIDSVLLSSLNGGSGITLGTISIQSRAALGATSIDLSAATSVKDVIDTINNANAGVKASLNNSGNGIQTVDSTGTGTLHIADVAGTGAAALGIAGDFDLTKTTVNGANLQIGWYSENTLLSSLNGGKGIAPGGFQITTASGASITIDTSDTSIRRVGDLIQRINASGIGVTASINAHGDGLLLTDTTTGASKLKVEETDSTTAADLGIKSDGAVGTINGSYEKTVTIASTDTLADVQTKINNVSFGVTASIINDGSGNAPYRLSLNSKNSGRAGRVIFDAGTTSLSTHNLVDAQDAAVFLGSANSDQPLLVTASRNELSGVVKGVTVELHGTSDKPVTVNVSRDGKNASDEVQKFVDGFNALIDKVSDLTKFDTDTNKGGVLLGESTVSTVQTELYTALNAVVPAGGKYRTLADVGVTLTDDAKLSFDSDKFSAAYADDPSLVESLFTNSNSSLGGATLTSQLNDGAGVRHAASGPDLHISTRDGSGFNVTLGEVTTVGDVIRQIDQASGGKINATIGANNNLLLTDTTTGSGATRVQPSGISQAIIDLGLNGGAASSAGVIAGARLSFSTQNAKNVGAGVLLESAIGRLIDPVTGAIPQENKTLDTRTQQFQDRIDQLDKLIDAKRTRLENQFANMESVLSGLQSQQKALGSLSSSTASSK